MLRRVDITLNLWALDFSKFTCWYESLTIRGVRVFQSRYYWKLGNIQDCCRDPTGAAVHLWISAPDAEFNPWVRFERKPLAESVTLDTRTLEITRNSTLLSEGPLGSPWERIPTGMDETWNTSVAPREPGGGGSVRPVQAAFGRFANTCGKCSK